MEKNLGFPDKIIRTAVAFFTAVLLFSDVIPRSMALIVLLPSVILLVTAIFGYCPLYTGLGINTCKR